MQVSTYVQVFVVMHILFDQQHCIFIFYFEGSFHPNRQKEEC